MCPECGSGSRTTWSAVRIGKRGKGHDEEATWLSVQDSLNKHDPTVIPTCQCHPHGDPAGPLKLFSYFKANLKYFKLNQSPTGDKVYCHTAATYLLHHNKTLVSSEWTHTPSGTSTYWSTKLCTTEKPWSQSPKAQWTTCMASKS